MATAHDINQFFADRNVQMVIEASRTTAPLEICYPDEYRISSFIGWILDPTQGHGMNGAALRALLTACWRSAEEAGYSVVDRRPFAPAPAASYAYTDAVIEQEVRLNGGSGRLDLLVMLPRQRMLIAIENKFGARQGDEQLSRYRKALEKEYEGWTRVLVYLDVYGRSPNDEGWIGLDYGWLTEELRVAELSSWLGEASRQTIAQFRRLLDPQADDNLPGVEEHRLRAIVRAHGAVLTQMDEWAYSAASPAELAASVFESSKGEDSKALQMLYPVYWQRRHLWWQCIAMLGHASLQEKADQHYGEKLECDPKRKYFYFTLKPWHALAASADAYWPVQVAVRSQRNDEDATETYTISSVFNLSNIDDKHRDAVAQVAKQLRTDYMKRNRSLDDDRDTVTVRVSPAANRKDAADFLHRHLAELETSLRHLV